MQEGKSILSHLWDEMDTKIAAVTPMAAESKRLKADFEDALHDSGMGDFDVAHAETAYWQHEAEKNKVGGIGRGLATAIRLMSGPQNFATDNDVVKHAMARYKASLAGEVIDTPGNPGTYVTREPSADDAEPEPAVITDKETGERMPALEGVVNTNNGVTPKDSSPADPESPPQATSKPSSDSEPGSTQGLSAATGKATRGVDSKKAVSGAPKSTTVDQSSADASGATSSTTETSHAPLSSAREDDPDRPPTPDEVLDSPSDERAPNTRMSVDEAIRRAKQRQYEAKKDDPRYNFDDQTIASEHSADDIAQMLEGLPDDE